MGNRVFAFDIPCVARRSSSTNTLVIRKLNFLLTDAIAPEILKYHVMPTCLELYQIGSLTGFVLTILSES